MEKNKVNVAVQVRVHPDEFPTTISCPLPNMSVWNMHPKVFLAPDADQRAQCPYCGTNYILIDE